MSAEMRQLAAAIIKMQDQLRNSTTTIQLNNSSIEDGVLEIKNSSGDTVMEIGQQWDGSLGATPLTGPEPPTPSIPIADPTPGGVTIRWDGEFFDALAMADFSRVEVHVSPDPMLTGEYAETLRGTIETPRGGEVHLKGLDSSTDYYVVFICRSTSGKRGPMSAIASFRPGIRELVAMEAYQAAIDAQAAADASLTAANGKNTITWSQSTPPGITTLTTLPDGSQGYPAFETTTRTSGDTWFQYGANGVVLQLEYSIDAFDGGAGWLVRPITDSVIANLSAGKITTGVLQAGTQIITGDPNATHTVIGQSSLQVFRKRDADEEPQASISVGGADQDVLLITDPTTGETIAGFNGNGDGMARDFEVNSLSVGGTPLGDPTNPDDLLFDTGYGVRDWGAPTGNTGNFGTTELGSYEIAFDAKAGRTYRITFHSAYQFPSSGNNVVQSYLRFSGTGAAPTITSTVIGWAGIASGGWAYATGTVVGYLTPAADYEARVLQTNRMVSGSAYGSVYSSAGSVRAVVEDIGPSRNLSGLGQLNAGGGTPYQASAPVQPPSTVKKTYKKTYTASWSRGWRGSTITGNELRHGYYSGTKYTGMFGFPSQLQSDLAGSTISRMRVYVYANHWYYSSGGTGYFGCVGNSSAPSSPPAAGVGDYVFSGKWSQKSGGLWMNVPSGSWPYWVSGAIKGISVGDFVSSTSLSYYSRYNGAGMPYPPKIEVTYTK